MLFRIYTGVESIKLLADTMGVKLDQKALEQILSKVKKEADEKGFALEEEVCNFINRT